jgi:preprotein translocase subunit YajC
MANFFSDLLEFVLSVVGAYAWYSTGGVTVALVALWFLVKDRPIPRNVLIVLAFLFLFLAVFKAWREEHNSLASLQDNLKKPTFNAQIGGIFAGVSKVGKDKFGMIYLAANISNPHGPASGLMNWKMGIRNPKVGISWGGFLPLFEKGQSATLGPGMGGVTFTANKHLPSEAYEPIPAGAWISGWFGSTFTRDQMDEAYRERYFLVLQFEDVVSGGKHTIERQFPEPGTHPIVGAETPND